MAQTGALAGGSQIVWWSLGFPIFLLVLSLGLIATHVRAWRQAKRTDLEPRELDFAWRQCRRRLQASGMLALVAVAMLAGPLISPRESPTAFAVLWFLVVIVVAWAVLLALVDALATHYHLSRQRHRYKAEEDRLRAELERLKRRGQNGHAERSITEQWSEG